MQFPSLEHRMLHTYVETFPPFVPAPTEEVPEPAQREMHAFFGAMYRTLAENPSLWFSALHEDDAHPNRFNKSSYGKPKLVVDMRKVLKTMDQFLDALFTLAARGRPEGSALVLADAKAISRKHRPVLAAVGLNLEGSTLSHDQYPAMFAAWHWMATRPRASMVAFSRCMFDSEHAYTSDVFGRLAGNGEAFAMLENRLLASGYRRVDCRDGEFRWDYVKCHGDEDAPVGGFVFDHNHSGVAAEYEHVIEPPQCFGLRILRMRETLPKFDGMDDGLKEFVLRHNRRCDKCGYCVARHKNRQTSAPPKLFATTVEHRGKRIDLCPLFPGFNYCWTSLDEDLVEGIVAFLTFTERQVLAG